MAALCDLGEVLGSDTVQSRYVFESKVYRREDAIEINRETFAASQILQGTELDGASAIRGAIQQPLVTLHEGVSRKTRLDRFEIKSRLRSKVNSDAGACAFEAGSTRMDQDATRYLCTNRIFQNEEICPKDFIGTWKESMVGRSCLNSEESVVISDEITYAFRKAATVSFDQHAWGGNYGGADPNTAHADGFIKKAVLALNSSQPEIREFTGSGTWTGLGVDILAGGRSVTIPFDTDINTTLLNVETELEGDEYVDPVTGLPLFSSVVVAGSVITVTGQNGVPIQLSMIINDGSDLKKCIDDTDGMTILTSSYAGGAGLTMAITQNYTTNASPIATDLTVITVSNVYDELYALYSAISDTRPELLNADFGGILHVAQNVYTALAAAQTQETKTFIKQCDTDGMPCISFMGMRLNVSRYMPKDHLFFARPEDLHVGVNYLPDTEEIRMGIRQPEGTAYFKNCYSMGFQIGAPENIAGTFTDPSTVRFPSIVEATAEQPCEA